MTLSNRQLVVRKRPDDAVTPAHFTLLESPVPRLAAGEALVRVHWLGIDATQRTWLNPTSTYIDPVAIGEIMRGSGVGEVVASKTKNLAVGDWAYGMTGWQEYVVARAQGLYGLNRVPPGVEPMSMLHLFGASGLTAYFGVSAVGAPDAGNTVFVTAAAGSVGSIAGQIAKIRGARVFGTASSREKRAWLVNELGFDGAIDYRADDFDAQLRALMPEGIDVVFDNVGGPVLEAALDNLALGARIILCGSISSGYRENAYGRGPRNYMQLGFRRARMEGFVFLDFADRFAEAFEHLSRWHREGLVKCRYDVVDGLENAPAALQGLFEGENIGKQLVRL